MVTSSDSSVALLSAADTMRYNIGVFSSLGAVKDNLRLFYDRVGVLTPRGL